jgi:hypothetical protein
MMGQHVADTKDPPTRLDGVMGRKYLAVKSLTPVWPCEHGQHDPKSSR